MHIFRAAFVTIKNEINVNVIGGINVICHGKFKVESSHIAD